MMYFKQNSESTPKLGSGLSCTGPEWAGTIVKLQAKPKDSEHLCRKSLIEHENPTLSDPTAIYLSLADFFCC